MRILFTSPHCLLDPASGAAASMRTLLAALAGRGHEVRTLTGGICDAPDDGAAFAPLRPAGDPWMPEAASAGQAGATIQAGQIGECRLDGVLHRVHRFGSVADAQARAQECERLYRDYEAQLGGWRPQAVITFGGFLYNRWVLAQARQRGIHTAFYLAAEGYRRRDAFGFADRIFAVSAAVAHQCGVGADPRLRVISSLIDLDAYRVWNREPRDLVFVNPEPAKGLSVFAAVAGLAQRLGRPHRFLVVESRQRWKSAVALLPALARLRNVEVLPRQSDMRVVYRRAQALMFPSLWQEAAGRVLREAAINGIPVIAHRIGGVVETLSDGPVLLDPPGRLLDDFLAPVPESFAQEWLAALDRLGDDPVHYARQSARVRSAAQGYSLDALVTRVEAELLMPQPLSPAAASSSERPKSLAPLLPHRILCASLHCLLDAGSREAARLRGLLQGLAARGHDVRVLCGSALQPPGDASLLLAAPLSGRWREVSRAAHREIRGGLLQGVIYRVLRFESDEIARVRAREEQALFLALLDLEHGWRPQAMITGDDSLFSRVLRRRAESNGIAAAAWSAGRLSLPGCEPEQRGSALDLLEATLCGGSLPPD